MPLCWDLARNARGARVFAAGAKRVRFGQGCRVVQRWDSPDSPHRGLSRGTSAKRRMCASLTPPEFANRALAAAAAMRGLPPMSLSERMAAFASIQDIYVERFRQAHVAFLEVVRRLLFPLRRGAVSIHRVNLPRLPKPALNCTDAPRRGPG